MRRPAVVAAALVPAFALAGCTKTFDQNSLQNEVKRLLVSQGLNATSATCPGNVTAKAGESFSCTATANGKQYTVAATADNDKGAFTIHSVKPVGAGSGAPTPSTPATTTT